MSINWHYFKSMNKKTNTMFPKAGTATNKDMYSFTSYRPD